MGNAKWYAAAIVVIVVIAALYFGVIQPQMSGNTLSITLNSNNIPDVTIPHVTVG